MSRKLPLTTKNDLNFKINMMNTNMMLRYISGTGAEGMKVSPEIGRQLYSDIQEQERLFQDPEYRSLESTLPIILHI